jgi:predicted transcriptional regulator
MSQVTLNKFEERSAEFARVRAFILKILNQQPGLTVEEVSKEFMLRYGFLPRIDNRLRELRSVGFVESKEEADKLLHWFPKQVEGSGKT